MSKNSRSTVERTAGFREGEPAAIAEMVRIHSPRLRRILAKRGCPPQDLDDVVQRTWVRALAARQRVDPARPFGAWVARIAVRLWWDDLRRGDSRKAAGHTDADDLPDAADPEPLDLIDGLIRDETLRAMAVLPPDQREAILLTTFEGLSTREATEVTGTGVSGVKSRVSRGYATLRGYLDDPTSRPAPPDRRVIELDVAGCERCDELLALVRAIRCPSCEVTVREVESDGPRLRVDHRDVQGLDGALSYAGTLRALGIGVCAPPDKP